MPFVSLILQMILRGYAQPAVYSLLRSPGVVKLSSVIKNLVRMCNVKLQTSFQVQMITA